MQVWNQHKKMMFLYTSTRIVLMLWWMHRWQICRGEGAKAGSRRSWYTKTGSRRNPSQTLATPPALPKIMIAQTHLLSWGQFLSCIINTSLSSFLSQLIYFNSFFMVWFDYNMQVALQWMMKYLNFSGKLKANYKTTCTKEYELYYLKGHVFLCVLYFQNYLCILCMY